MQKISGILPNSARVSSVDLKEAHPVRPGTPGFGRPEGVSSLKDRQQAVDAMRRSQEITDEIFGVRTKEGHESAMVQKITDNFFLRNRKDVGAPTGDGMQVGAPQEAPTTASLAAQVKTAARNAEVATEKSEPAIEPDGLYPKGSFVDVVA